MSNPKGLNWKTVDTNAFTGTLKEHWAAYVKYRDIAAKYRGAIEHTMLEEAVSKKLITPGLTTLAFSYQYGLGIAVRSAKEPKNQPHRPKLVW
jgi:hypothetical protein